MFAEGRKAYRLGARKFCPGMNFWELRVQDFKTSREIEDRIVIEWKIKVSSLKLGY